MIELKHYLHSSFEKSLMERVNQYFKDRTEGFDDYYHVLEMNVHYFMHIIGDNFLFLYTIVLQQQVVIILILSLREMKLL